MPVVRGADAVLGHQQRHRATGVVPGAPEAVAERGRVVLVAHVEDGHAVLVTRPAAGTDQHPGVDLHPQEVVPSGRVEKHVLGVMPDALELLLTTGCELVVGHGQSQPDRDARCSGANRLHRHAVRRGETGGHGAGERQVLLARGEHAGMPAHGGHDVGLVDRAGTGHHIAQRLGHDTAEAAEALDGQIGLPAALGRQPPGRREVVERHHRVHAPLAEPEALAPVVRQCRQ